MSFVFQGYGESQESLARGSRPTAVQQGHNTITVDYDMIDMIIMCDFCFSVKVKAKSPLLEKSAHSPSARL